MTPVSLAPVGPFTFKKNLPLLNQNASLGFAVTGDLQPDVLAALASDTAPFPARDIELAEVSLTTGTAAPIEFARGSEKVTFAASAEAFAGFGVYRSGARLLQRLGDGADDVDLAALEFGNDATSLLGVLRWGYAAEAKGTGAVALGPVGTATAKVAGKGSGLFAVVRRMSAETPARRVVQGTADSWLMPRQIASIDQVEPGTWIIAEVAGSISLSLGAQLGYDFNWVRAAKLGGLTGDIGLRLQMGINAAIGFSASGRSAVVVSRDSDARALRLRIFRLKTRQVDASLDAKLSVKAIDKLLPDKVDDFIAAVFDTHGQQILKDLKVLDQWTDPKKSLAELLANAGVDGAENLVAHLAGVSPANLQNAFDAVHSRAVAFIQQWHRLPHSVSSTLLKLVEEKADLAGVREVARTLSTITEDKLKSLLETELNRIDFFHTPVGRLLESIAGEGVLSLLGKLDEAQAVGKQVLAIVDGQLLEDTLVKFQSFIESELRLDKVFGVVDETGFAHLDGLLKRKLAKFLDQDTIVLKDLEKVRKVIRLLLDKRNEYYEKALNALHRKYNFEMNAAYQSTTTDRALLDATYDFSHDPAAVSTFFQQAVQGKLDDLFTTQPAQVTIAAGKLSHGVTRQTSIDVSLPFVNLSEVHLNESVASLSVVPNSGGLLFKLNASDTVASNQRKSVLSLAMGLSATPVSRELRLHEESLEMNYTLLFARRNMQIKHVRAQVGPAAQAFFATKIPDVEGFLQFLDRQAEDAIPNGPNLLGNGLISLQVSLAAGAAKQAGQAWVTLPPDRGADVYLRMSNAVQSSLKRNIHDGVFSSPEAYTNAIGTALTVLAYCAIVPRAPKVTSRFGLPFWDFEDAAEVRTMLAKPQTVAKMTELLTRAQEILLGDSDAEFFRPDDARSILAAIKPSDPLLHSLLVAEADVVKHAFEAGVAIASARDAKPSEALAAVSKFGSKLTEAFNADITVLLGPGIQALGTRVFLDASRALDQARSKEITETHAMLNLEFLKPDSTFDGDALLRAGRVPGDALAFADRVVELQARG